MSVQSPYICTILRGYYRIKATLITKCIHIFTSMSILRGYYRVKATLITKYIHIFTSMSILRGYYRIKATLISKYIHIFTSMPILCSYYRLKCRICVVWGCLEALPRYHDDRFSQSPSPNHSPILCKSTSESRATRDTSTLLARRNYSTFFNCFKPRRNDLQYIPSGC